MNREEIPLDDLVGDDVLPGVDLAPASASSARRRAAARIEESDEAVRVTAGRPLPSARAGVPSSCSRPAACPSLVRRLAAFVVDLLVVVLPVFGLALLFEALSARAGRLLFVPLELEVGAVVVLGWFVAAFGPLVLRGGTPGKRLAGLTVVAADGRRGALWRLFVRRVALDGVLFVLVVVAVWLAMLRQHGGWAAADDVRLFARTDWYVFAAFFGNLAFLYALLRGFDPAGRFLHDRLAAVRVAAVDDPLVAPVVHATVDPAVAERRPPRALPKPRPRRTKPLAVGAPEESRSVSDPLPQPRLLPRHLSDLDAPDPVAAFCRAVREDGERRRWSPSVLLDRVVGVVAPVGDRSSAEPAASASLLSDFRSVYRALRGRVA